MAEMIDTSIKGWQKKLEKCLRQNKKVLIVTKDEELANALVAGNLKGRHIRRIVFGAEGLTPGLAGIPAVVASAIPWDTSLETIIVILMTTLRALRKGTQYAWLDSLTAQLAENKYKFKLVEKKDEESVIEGKPATA